MANTYTQLHIHFVFAVADHGCLISEELRPKIERFMCGIVERLNSKPIAIYCNPDHCHLLVGIHPRISVSDLSGKVKALTSKWINENQLTPSRFYWQAGYGAFACSKRQTDRVVSYIQNQPIHHRNRSFRDEYIEFLKEHDVNFDERYLFSTII